MLHMEVTVHTEHMNTLCGYDEKFSVLNNR
jgi:hypothetical protein